MPQRYYLLDEELKPVEADFEEWAKAMEEIDRTVARDVIGGTLVSTVFLGIDHSYTDRGPPILFETMIFGGGQHDGYQDRCCTWEGARKMHSDAVRLVRNS